MITPSTPASICVLRALGSILSALQVQTFMFDCLAYVTKSRRPSKSCGNARESHTKPYGGTESWLKSQRFGRFQQGKVASSVHLQRGQSRRRRRRKCLRPLDASPHSRSTAQGMRLGSATASARLISKCPGRRSWLWCVVLSLRLLRVVLHRARELAELSPRTRFGP